MKGSIRRSRPFLAALVFLHVLQSVHLITRTRQNQSERGEEALTSGNIGVTLRHGPKTVSLGAAPPPLFAQQHQVRTSLPIFDASLPKSGTTTLSRFFYCNHIHTAHTFARTPRGELRVGECFWANVKEERQRVWDECGDYSVFSDTGFVRGSRCFYPSVHGLNELLCSYPQQTWILVQRNATAWYNSLMKWKAGALVRKWRACAGFPPKDPTQRQLEDFYETHNRRIREFVANHSSRITYVELFLEDADAGLRLAEKLGLNASCWGHHNSHEKRMRLNPRFRKQFLAQQAMLHNTTDN